MDTEQRYLRDIRDAIKGDEKRSSMQSNGNEKAKYLKDIADAIRENGGGSHDGNDKVKQTPIQNGVFDVLLSKSASGEGEKTEGANKSQKYKLKCSTHGGYLTMEGPTGFGDNTGAASLESGSNPGVSAQKITTVDEGGTSYQRRDAIKVNLDDIVLSSNKMGGGSVDNPNTWDGTNTSLKAALANAKSNDIFVANFSLVSTGDYLYPMFLQETGYTISSTGPSVNYGTQNEFYLDKSYEEILSAIQAGKIPLILSPAKQIWVLYSTPSQSEDAMVFEDIKNHAFYFDDEDNELIITTSKITIMPSPSPTNG